MSVAKNFKLQWAISGANTLTTCLTSGDWSSGQISNSSGEVEIKSTSTIPNSYNYGIKCSDNIVSASDNVIVNTINSPPAINLRIGNSRYEIFKPTDTANIRLNWNSTYADSCLASGDWSGSKDIGDPNVVSESLSKPRGSYSFTLSCSGMGGSTEKIVATQVIQVPQCSFSADKSSIVLPDTATLSWSCDYVSGGGGGCSINQNIGSVGSSGSKEVRPSKTTPYTLTCNGLDGSRDFYTTVNINNPLKIKYQEVIPR